MKADIQQDEQGAGCKVIMDGHAVSFTSIAEAQAYVGATALCWLGRPYRRQAGYTKPATGAVPVDAGLPAMRPAQPAQTWPAAPAPTQSPEPAPHLWERACPR